MMGERKEIAATRQGATLGLLLCPSNLFPPASHNASNISLSVCLLVSFILFNFMAQH